MDLSSPVVDGIMWISLGVIAVTLWGIVIALGIRGDL